MEKEINYLLEKEQLNTFNKGVINIQNYDKFTRIQYIDQNEKVDNTNKYT